MRIAFLTTYDSTNVRNWSGLGYYIAKSLEQQGVELIRIDCSVKFSKFQLIKRKLIKLGLGKILQPERDNTYLKRMAARASQLLAGQQYDLIFSPGSLPLSFLRSDKPIVFFTDATYESLVNLYIGRNRLWNGSFEQGNRAEEKAIQNASLIFYSSKWAKETAITRYRANPDKIKLLSFGPNLESELSMADMQTLINRRKQKTEMNFLFIGVDWDRKGASIAIETIAQLNAMGKPATITMAGCQVPPGITLPPFVIHHPFISKDGEEGRKKLRSLFENADFFMLPTQADCTPVVFSEAASFGLPVITTDVGGCTSVVVDGVTGYCLHKENFVAEATKKIAALWSDKEQYETFCRQAFRHYENELNWDAIGKKAITEMQQVLKKHDTVAIPA